MSASARLVNFLRLNVVCIKFSQRAVLLHPF
jgi:hypothetical protein